MPAAMGHPQAVLKYPNTLPQTIDVDHSGDVLHSLVDGRALVDEGYVMASRHYNVISAKA
jgi:hypothetical protein